MNFVASFFMVLVCLPGFSFAQDNREERARQLMLSDEYRREARMLLEAGEYREAVAAYLRLIQLNEQIYEKWGGLLGSVSDIRLVGYPQLAHAYRELDQPIQAMEVYRRLVFWDELRNDFSLDIVVGDTYYHYPVLLAGQNRNEDAKAVYYALLRRFESRSESVPFRVVFDEDIDGDSWSYSEKRLKAAVKMLWALALTHRSAESMKVAQEASELWPEWNYPYLFLAQYEKDEGLRGPLFDKAIALSRSEEERQMIRQVAGRLAEGTVEVPSGKDVRKKMKVLEDWRKKAERGRGSYASG